jgi:hypothetical protein
MAQASTATNSTVANQINTIVLGGKLPVSRGMLKPAKIAEKRPAEAIAENRRLADCVS